MHTPNPRRLRPSALSLALSSALLATAAVSPMANAATASGDADQIVGAGAPADQAGITVTLITGDQAVVSVDADGRASAYLRSEEDYVRQREGDDLYLIPVSALKAVQAGTLDRQLFNVTGLVRAGYDDASRDDIPVIVTGPMPRAQGVSTATRLESIGASAVSIDKDSPVQTFSMLSQARTSRKIWLDGKVESLTALDPATGVGQTGADQVWARGLTGSGVTVAVLDTGVDGDHPDLVDRIVQSQDFTGEGVDDRDGHGTHVASTVAGTGAASDGARAGMAPDADLLVGKVLGLGGGQESWIIEGMEWAVASGANVVNMSLGTTEPTDCTDPIAQALESLSTESLFVVAAGNLGGPEMVTSPGCTEGALTVAAVDAEGGTARFSSRGPTPDHRVKPDIAAPGVAITGAQAGGDYVGMSGTSMASPHVAGAAALVRQAHPDWTVEQVRHALTSSVKTRPSDGIYAQGAGELWVPGAVDAQVLADSSINLGTFEWPHAGTEQLSADLTYTNTGTEAVRLQLKLRDLTGADGQSIPGNSVRLDRSTVHLAPGESTSVRITATDRTQGMDAATLGGIGGRVLATTQDGQQVTSSFGYWLEPETVDLTLDVTGHDGQPATAGFLTIVQRDDIRASQVELTGEPVTVRVPAGALSIHGFLIEEGAGGVYDFTYLGRPELSVDESTTLSLDAREAAEVQVRTDRPTESAGSSLTYGQILEDYWYVGGSVVGGAGARLFALPAKQVHDTDFMLSTYWRMAEKDVDASRAGYVYNLAFREEGRVSADQTRTVRDADLATVDESWYAQRNDGLLHETVAARDEVTGDLVALGSWGQTVLAPHDRTALYTPGVAWSHLVSSNLFMVETMVDPERVYEAGQHTSTEWNRLPSMTGLHYLADGSPSRIAERQGNLVGFSFAHWKDSVDGRSGVGGFGDLGNLRFWIDGEEQEHSAWAAGQWQVPDESVLTVQANHFRLPTFWNKAWLLGTQTSTTFTFESRRPQGDEIVPLPLALPTFDVPVDERNLVPAEAGTEITLGFRHQEGHEPAPIVEVTAQVTDEELPLADVDAFPQAAWQDVEVVQRDGVWTLLVDNTAYSGKQPSLHVVAVDADGNRVEQYLSHAYGVQ